MIENVIKNVQDSDVDNIMVVLGADRNELVELVSKVIM